MKIKNFRVFGSILALAMSIFSTFAMAGREIEIDQGDNYDVSGQKWSFPGDYFHDSFSTVGSSTVSVPILLNIGAGAQNYRFSLDVGGRVVLLDGSGNATSDYIAPLYHPASTFTPDPGIGGFIAFGAGQIDPSILTGTPTPPFDLSNALTVYRFLWRNVCSPLCSGSGLDDTNFEAVLIDRGNGDFDLDFNYGDPQGPAPTGAIGGFLLGLNEAAFTSFTSPGPDYCFRGGVGSLCSDIVNPNPVPEPGTVALVLAGLGLLYGSRRRFRAFVPRALIG